MELSPKRSRIDELIILSLGHVCFSCRDLLVLGRVLGAEQLNYSVNHRQQRCRQIGNGAIMPRDRFNGSISFDFNVTNDRQAAHTT